MRLMILCGFLLLALCLPAQAASPWSVGGEWSAAYDSNIANAPAGQVERSSGLIEGNAGLERSFALADPLRLLLRGSLAAQFVERASGYNQVQPGALARFYYQPGQSLFTPVLMFTNTASYRAFDSTQRTGGEYRSSVGWLQRLSTQISMRMSGGVSQRWGRNDVFDLRGHSAALDLEWQPLPRWNLRAGYQYQRGDVVATSMLGVAVRDAAEVIEVDDVFTDERVYRLDTRSHIGSIGLNYALSPTLSLDGQLQYINASSVRNADVYYTRWIGTGGLLWRWE